LERQTPLWKHHPLLSLSENELTAHSKEWAFVVVLFTPPRSNVSLEEHMLSVLKWTTHCSKLAERFETLQSLQQDGQYLTCLFDRVDDALLMTFELIKLHQHAFHIGIGSDKGYMFDYFIGPELLRLKAALHHGNTAEIQMTPNAYHKLTLPDGVGAFQCSPLLAQRTGMNYWILKDYR